MRKYLWVSLAPQIIIKCLDSQWNTSQLSVMQKEFFDVDPFPPSSIKMCAKLFIMTPTWNPLPIVRLTTTEIIEFIRNDRTSSKCLKLKLLNLKTWFCKAQVAVSRECQDFSHGRYGSDLTVARYHLLIEQK